MSLEVQHDQVVGGEDDDMEVVVERSISDDARDAVGQAHRRHGFASGCHCRYYGRIHGMTVKRDLPLVVAGVSHQ